MIIAAVSPAVSAFLQTGIVTLGKSALYLLIQFGQYGGILNGGKCQVWKFIPLGAYVAASSIRFKSSAETCCSV